MEEKNTYNHIWNVKFENSTNEKTNNEEKKENLTLLRNVLKSIDPQYAIDKNVSKSNICNSDNQKTK